MLLHLKIAGMSMLCLGLLHGVFPKRFHWKTDLAKLQDINRQIFWVHCFFICVVLWLMGSLCFFRPEALLAGGELAQLLAGGMSFFWFLRLLAQLFVYDQKLWRGKTLETFVHIVFTLLWSYYSSLFLLLFLKLNVS